VNTGEFITAPSHMTSSRY